MIPNLTLIISIYATVRLLEIVINEYEMRLEKSNVALSIVAAAAIPAIWLLAYETIKLRWT